MWYSLSYLSLIVGFLKRCSSAGITEKLFQCAAKLSESEEIDKRIDHTGEEQAKVEYLTRPTYVHHEFFRVEKNPDTNTYIRNITDSECHYSNDHCFSRFDIQLKSGFILESRQV